MKFKSRPALVGIAILVLVIAVGAVNLTGKSKTKDVTLVTHDSFVMSKDQIKNFAASTGYDLKLVKAGDAGALTNRLILTKGAPIADVVFGIDNTFASLAKNSGIISGSLVATDFGDVCLNYDKTWFAVHKVVAPRTLDDLISPKYKGLTVIENPNTSSTGLSFLAATVDKYGTNGWQGYWKALKKNMVKVDNGWESAYYTDFSGSSGKGAYPIVLSYATSPADEVRSNGQSQTASILDGCFRQTEYVGILKKAHNPDGAKAVVKFLLSNEFQKSFPSAMYMYPIVKGVTVPANWSQFAKVPEKTFGDNLNFTIGRKVWLTGWSAIFA